VCVCTYMNSLQTGCHILYKVLKMLTEDLFSFSFTLYLGITYTFVQVLVSLAREYA